MNTRYFEWRWVVLGFRVLTLLSVFTVLTMDAGVQKMPGWREGMQIGFLDCLEDFLRYSNYNIET